MYKFRCRLIYSTALAICLMTGCTTTARLPTITPPTADYYPPASRRLEEEGRVLVEFHLDQRRTPFDQQTIQSEVSPANGRARLESTAIKVVSALQFDPSDHTKPDPKHAYRVTIIFCLDPGHCGTLSPFSGTHPIVVKTQAFHWPEHETVVP